MKKFVLIFSFLLLISSFSFANADSYRIDDSAIEILFDQAEEISIFDANLSDLAPEANMFANPEQLNGSNNPVVAFVLAWFLGGLGVHRLYLGTEVIVFVAYLCTGGGFGILACGDWIVLLIGLIDDDISKYVDNPALIMW